MTRSATSLANAQASTRDRHVQHVGVLIPDLAGMEHPAAGRCLYHGHGHDPALWFDDSKEGSGRERAKAICGRCPVQPQCLDYARRVRRHTIVHGVWGGVYFTERKGLER
jgi:WhiB family redox-sensing transcriptional regulator